MADVEPGFCFCGGTGRTVKVFKDLIGRSWRVGFCPVHGVGFLDPMPTEQFLLEYYRDFFAGTCECLPTGGYTDGSDSELQKMRDRADRYVQRIRRRVTTGRILEVGCATGVFLDSAKSSGFETFGLDFDASAAAISREKGHTVLSGTLRQVGSELGQFDVVAMFQTLEHLMTPLDDLKIISNALKPGGLLIVDCPNWGSPLVRFHDFRKRHWHHYLPCHLYYWSPRGVRALCQMAGLKVVSQRTPVNLVLKNMRSAKSLSSLAFSLLALPVWLLGKGDWLVTEAIKT